jgi:hypothetical protein
MHKSRLAFAPYYSATFIVSLVGGAGAANATAALGGAIAYFALSCLRQLFAQHVA